MLSWVFLCASAVAAAGAGPVFAGIVPLSPELEARAERAAIALGQTLEKQAVVDLGTPPLPETADELAGALANLVAAARSTYLEADFQTSLARADEAINRFEGAGAFRAGSGWSSYEQALLLRALALRKLGKEAESDSALTRLAGLRPQAVPDPELTPPKIVQRHQQLLGELRAAPRAQLEVVSSPEGAEVLVDGRSVGRAPVVVRDLSAGIHFISLSAQGARVDRKVSAAGGDIRVEAQVGDVRIAPAHALRGALTTPTNKPAIVARATAVGDDVFFGVLAPHGDDALLVLARARGGDWEVVGTLVELKGQITAQTNQLVDALLAGRTGWLGTKAGARLGNPEEVLLRGGPVRAPHVPDDPVQVEPESDGGGWLLVGVGVGIAAAVAGAVVVGVFVAAETSNNVGVTVDASKL